MTTAQNQEAARSVSTQMFSSANRIGLPAGPITRKAKKLRVSIVSDAIQGRNGVGTYYSDLVQYLQPHVSRIDLLAPEAAPDRRFEAFSLPMPGDRTQRLAWPQRSRLTSRLNEVDPDVLVIPSLGAFSYFGMRYALSRKIALAVVHHTNFDHLLSLYWSRWSTFPFRFSLRLLNRWLCRKASGVAAMNADALQEASSAGSRFTRVMGTPLSFEFLSTPTSGVSNRIRRAIFVGRLAEEKGIPKILDAAQANPGIEFAIAGDGPWKPKVQEAEATLSNIKYLGWISRARVLQEIDNSEILLLPSQFETFGTVALEALARKRFVIASDACGIVQWPMFGAGIFQFAANESLSEAVKRVSNMCHAERVHIANLGWDNVEPFNQHTVSNWLKFLVDTASENLR